MVAPVLWLGAALLSAWFLSENLWILAIVTGLVGLLAFAVNQLVPKRRLPPMVYERTVYEEREPEYRPPLAPPFPDQLDINVNHRHDHYFHPPTPEEIRPRVQGRVERQAGGREPGRLIPNPRKELE